MINPNSLYTLALCSVWCVYGNVCVTHGHIWISKSVCVCLCQGSVLVFELPVLCGLPWMPYWDSLSLSSSVWLMSKQKRDREGKREGGKRRRRRREWLVRRRNNLLAVAVCDCSFHSPKGCSWWLCAFACDLSGGWRGEISRGTEEKEEGRAPGNEMLM